MQVEHLEIRRMLSSTTTTTTTTGTTQAAPLVIPIVPTPPPSITDATTALHIGTSQRSNDSSLLSYVTVKIFQVNSPTSQTQVATVSWLHGLSIFSNYYDAAWKVLKPTRRIRRRFPWAELCSAARHSRAQHQHPADQIPDRQQPDPAHPRTTAIVFFFFFFFFLCPLLAQLRIARSRRPVAR